MHELCKKLFGPLYIKHISFIKWLAKILLCDQIASINALFELEIRFNNLVKILYVVTVFISIDVATISGICQFYLFSHNKFSRQFKK